MDFNMVDMAGLFNELVRKQEQEKDDALRSVGPAVRVGQPQNLKLQALGYDQSPGNPQGPAGDFRATIAQQNRAPGISQEDLARYQGVSRATQRLGDDAAMRARVQAQALLSTPQAAADPRAVFAAGEQARGNAAGDFFKGAAAAQGGYGEETKRAEQALREYGLKVTEPQKEAAALERAKLESDTKLETAGMGAKAAVEAPLMAKAIELESQGRFEEAQSLRKNIAEFRKQYLEESRPRLQVGGPIMVKDQASAEGEQDALARKEAEGRRIKALSGLRSDLGLKVDPSRPTGKYTASGLSEGLAANPELLSDKEAVSRLGADVAAQSNAVDQNAKQLITLMRRAGVNSVGGWNLAEGDRGLVTRGLELTHPSLNGGKIGGTEASGYIPKALAGLGGLAGSALGALGVLGSGGLGAGALSAKLGLGGLGAGAAGAAGYGGGLAGAAAIPQAVMSSPEYASGTSDLMPTLTPQAKAKALKEAEALAAVMEQQMRHRFQGLR